MSQDSRRYLGARQFKRPTQECYCVYCSQQIQEEAYMRLEYEAFSTLPNGKKASHYEYDYYHLPCWLKYKENSNR